MSKRDYKATVDNMDVLFKRLLKDYGEEVFKVTQNACLQTARKARKEVSKYHHDIYSKDEKYDKSWKVRGQKVETYVYEADVWNKQYMLTHLLENGHWNFLTQDYTEEYKHIEPTQEKANEEFVKEVKARIEH